MQLLILHLIEVWHRTPVMGNGTKSLLYNSMKVLVIIVLVCIWSCESGGGKKKRIVSNSVKLPAEVFSNVWKSKCMQFVCCIYTLIVVRQNSSLAKFDVTCFDQEVKNMTKSLDYMFTGRLVLLHLFVTETYL